MTDMVTIGSHLDQALIFPSYAEAEAYIAELDAKGVLIEYAGMDGQGLEPPEVNLYIRAWWPAR